MVVYSAGICPFWSRSLARSISRQRRRWTANTFYSLKVYIVDRGFSDGVSAAFTWRGADVGEWSYSIDRMLTHLKLAGTQLTSIV